MGSPHSTPATKRPQFIASLRDTSIFPPFVSLPHEDNSDEEFFSDPWNSQPTPRRHWCFFGEIVFGFVYNNRLRLAVKDEVGTLFPVHFYTNDRGIGKQKLYRKGDTFVTLYATQHTFGDGTVGIRVNEGDRVEVLPHSMASLLEASDAILNTGVLDKCTGCGARKDEPESKALRTCEGCKIVRYCGEVGSISDRYSFGLTLFYSSVNKRTGQARIGSCAKSP